ncbi:alpha/beta fold hydrolase [bacterium]|nr:alpha/beta fold hydrolase [bacterium]
MIQSIDPESPRWSADLLLLHGAWTGPSTWGRLAAAMAQRGWRCHVVDLREAARGAAGGDWVAGASAAIRELETPPIAIGHGAGALVALALAGGPSIRAAVAAAPLAEGTRTLASLVDRIRLRLPIPGAGLEPPPPGHPVFAGLSPEDASRIAASMAAEPASFARWVDRAVATIPAPAVPALLLAQAEDPHARPVAVEVLARGLGAEFDLLPGGHFAPAGQRIDAWATRVHRWIVQRLGAELMLLQGDEDLRED